MFSSDVEPVTEQTSVPLTSSRLSMSLSAAHQQLLAGHVVRTGLADDLATLVGDGVRRQHQVDLAVLEERLAVVGDRLLPR